MATLDDRTRAIWTPRLLSALRTTVACSIVGIVTLYSPTSVRKYMPYPSFSYMTTILIVADANVGDTVRGAWNVIYATLQVMLLSILSLWLVGPSRFEPGLAATAVAICSFIVAVPESTRLLSKRIAFGQIVIVYVGTVVQGAKTPVVMHPVHVALSTGLGALASVLAVSFPYPRFACSQVGQSCRDYAENVVSRLNLYMEALYSDKSSTASELISQAMSYSHVGDKLLQTLISNQEGMLWERPDIRFLRPYYIKPSERLLEIELPLRGMEMALESRSSFPIRVLDEDIRQSLTTVHGFIARKLEQTKCIVPLDSTIAPETKQSSQDSLQTLKWIPSSVQDLSPMFYLFCMDLLRRDNRNTPIVNLKSNDSRGSRICEKLGLGLGLGLSNHSLLFALKCSISLGFAVLFGLMYDTKNGYWSGLTIAISFVTGKQPIFTVANARVQGTAIGSVYGVLGCLIFKNLFHLRLLPLIPWIVFASLLRHSRLYGEAGSIAASIGALLILGRTNYTTPTEFAIARLTEASIGLFCFVGAEILFQPSRAATLARTEVSRIFGTLGESILNFPSLDERFKLGQLQSQISSFEQYTRQAELEPNFWFHKFPTSCYLDLLQKIKKVSNLLQFLTSETDFLTETCPKIGLLWKDLLQQPLVKDELELFKEKAASSFTCLKKVISVNSLVKLDQDLRNKKKNIIHDIEIGDSSKSTMEAASLNEDLETISNPLLHELIKMIEEVYSHEGDEDLKRQMVLCMGGIGFCIDKLIREITAIEKTVKEVVQRQNPLCRVRLSEIACKVDASRELHLPGTAARWFNSTEKVVTRFVKLR